MADAKIKREAFVTPKGVFVYPRLRTPDTKFAEEGVYSLRLRLSAADAKPIMERIDAIIEEKFSAVKAELEKGDGKAKAKAKTLKRAADKPYRMAVDDDGNETGEVEFNFKMKASGVSQKTGKAWTRKPKVKDASGKKDVPASVDIWGGTVGRVAGEYNPFYTAIGVGCGLRLEGVQVLELKSGGDRDLGFGAEEGYTAEDDESATTTEEAGAAGSEDDDQF